MFTVNGMIQKRWDVQVYCIDQSQNRWKKCLEKEILAAYGWFFSATGICLTFVAPVEPSAQPTLAVASFAVAPPA